MQEQEPESPEEASAAGAPEAPRTRMQEIVDMEALNLEPLRNAVHTSRLKREEAAGNVDMANDEISRIDAELLKLQKQRNNWSRWRDYQRTRVEVFDRRMRLDREELRAIEDFQGEPE